MRLLDFNQNVLIKLFIILAIAVALFFAFAHTAAAYNYCSPYAYQQCEGKVLYWYDSCGNKQDSQYCPNGCWNNQCQDYSYSCAYHAYKNCIGNYLQWYDSCGNKQDSQYCQNGCYNDQCQNYNYRYDYNYGSCNHHAYRLCVGNNIYWYDSCGNQQELYQNCNSVGQICQYGQCIYQPIHQPPASPYASHYQTGCYKDNLYWYDSLGAITGLYKACVDSNSCTQDTCTSGACSNVVKCDGSTCAFGTADYIKYCASDKSHCGNGTCELNLGETTSACPSDCNHDNLSVLFLAKNSLDSLQWERSVDSGQDSQIYFMATVQNNGASQVNDVIVSADMPSEIVSLGNVQIDGVSVSRDIVSGVNVGSIGPLSSKTITFEGRTQAFSVQETKQASIKAVDGNISKTDFLEITFDPSQSSATAAISGTATSGFWEFLKRWYLWILVGVVLVFLFVIVFRRLSTNA